MKESLDSIGIRMMTDKASQFSRTYAKPHDYLRHLEPFFEPLRDKPIKLLEIGVGGGESIRTWLEYFSNSKIFGVDTLHGENEWVTPGSKASERYTFHVGHQGSSAFWGVFISAHGSGFDIIIDDGSHYAIDMKNAFTCLWSHLNSGGLYVVEDLNFDPNSKSWTESFICHIHAATFNIDSIFFAKELCVMRKR